MDGDEIAGEATRAAGQPVTELVPLPGGLTSINVAGRMGPDGARPVVVKVAPARPRAVRNRDVLRQGRILGALAGVDAATMALILKHNRCRSDPDAALEAQAPLPPRLLEWVAAHAG